MTVVLALDTSTEACSAALQIGARRIERFERLPRGHAARILGMLDALLEEAGVGRDALQAVAFGRGPGSFTGVRIACGVVQGLAYGLDLPVVPLSTLQLLAQGAARAHGAQRVLAAIDARMGELYWGGFELREGLMQPVLPETLGAADALPLPEGDGWLGVGTGWDAGGEILAQRLSGRLTAVRPQALPRALDCLPLAQRELAAGRAVDAMAALPVYLRDRVT